MNNSAIAAAKRRRAGAPPATAAASCSVPPKQQQQQQQRMQQQQPIPNTHKILTLKEVISYYDARILYLENLVKSGGFTGSSSVQEVLDQHIIEFDHRYELLAVEIENLKEAFMKLQTFTLDINKTITAERSQVSSAAVNEEDAI